jgi:hypothetical protein
MEFVEERSLALFQILVVEDCPPFSNTSYVAQRLTFAMSTGAALTDVPRRVGPAYSESSFVHHIPASIISRAPCNSTTSRPYPLRVD